MRQGGPERVVIGDEADRLDGQLTRARAGHQGIGAMGRFRDQDQRFDLVVLIGDLELGLQLVGDGLEVLAELFRLETRPGRAESQAREELAGLLIAETARAGDETALLLHLAGDGCDDPDLVGT